ncbi:MAG TPA: Lrp/AsnC family transcriptional regulator [Candidatus Diapherotrites archaeon]|uniref:Lrp/AsnC family transcriptional regulator n=1 Tax=Candidatus Iainarchaeum sp. TaxID=3101447 RepID=A0A7J4JNG8_9ARCH|nr:Lrp/AsnC family transcriptional regulator [Candidatus Diapherotrites archaeon]HIH16776.1 Lrp/AsnC family transcriptional regulator [Candidatus Diapherotrites archaeon]
MSKPLDEVDKLILNQLLTEAKIPNYKDLGKKMGLAPQTIHNRLQKLQKTGYILGFIPLLDLKKLGYALTALVQVSAAKGDVDTLARKYSNHKNVVGIYDILGQYDMLLITKFRSLEDLDFFIKEFQGKNPQVRSTHTISVLNVQKDTVTPCPLE